VSDILWRIQDVSLPGVPYTDASKAGRAAKLMKYSKSIAYLDIDAIAVMRLYVHPIE
jgi:hypothetical protein